MEDHIRAASSIQEHKTGPFNTTADVTITFVMHRCDYGSWHLCIITIKVIASHETK